MRNSKLWLHGLLFLLALGLAGNAMAGGNYYVTPNLEDGVFIAYWNPAAPPAGADLSQCSSTVDPYPVVLVNGTFSVAEDDFGGLASDLANAGYCVYTFNYGYNSSSDLIEAIGPVPESAQQLAAFVAQVQAQTGSAQVDLVGHSQGGMLTEYYAKILGDAGNVHRIVALSPTTHGTTLDGLTNLASYFPGANELVDDYCPACYDQEAGSAVITALDNGPIAQPGIGYTVIETQNETVVTPVGSSFINEPGVLNEYVQSFCPSDSVDHADLAYDNVVIQLVKNALTPAAAQAPNCSIEFPASAQ
jgi:pimeloyl-ACP methyl ester carboxylesterase